MPSRASPTMTSRTSPTISGSNAEVGSSNNITIGSMASARAIATRCCCPPDSRSEEHTSELQSLMRISYAVFCLKKKNNQVTNSDTHNIQSSRTNTYKNI